MANEYASLADLKLQIGAQNAADDSLLNKALESASRRIDKRCGDRRFYADGAATARTYNPRGRVVCERDGERLLLDDISAMTDLAVEVGSGSGGFASLAATEYEVGPENALVQGRPVTSALRLRGLWSSGSVPRVRVTARWGWPAIPPEVVEATLLLAARLYKRKASPDGMAGVGEWGPIRVSRLDPDVESLIAAFVIPGFA